MSLPVWTALTPVLAGKPVSKVTTDGSARVATTAGPTGTVRPAAPGPAAWQVTAGPDRAGSSGAVRPADPRERLGVHQDLGKIDTFLTNGPRHDVADDCFGYEAEPDQQPPDRHVLGLLLGEGDTQLIVRDQPLLNQQLSQAKFFALLGHLD